MTGVRRLFVLCLGWYLRHVPDHPGRWRLELWALSLAPALRQLSKPRAIAIPGIGRLVVDGSSQTGRMLMAVGKYESASTQVMRRHLRRGSRMIDVGANIGYFAIAAARAVGTTGSVVAFEPQAAVRERLAANVRLNDLQNVLIRSEALAASNATVDFYMGPESDTGLASLRPLGHASPVTLPQARFDDVWDGTPVTLVKIDVEGAELQVLLGMARCLERDRPDLILEVTDRYLRAMGDSAETLFTWLAGRGYRMAEIQEDGGLHPILDAASLARRPAQFNAFCKANPAGW